MKIEEYRRMLNEKDKEIQKLGNSCVPVRKAEIDKCMKKIFKMLDKYDEELKNGRAKDVGEEEENCTICLNVLIESTTLPCRHRFCI